MTKFLVSVIDPGCDCCSYVPVGTYESRGEIPARFLNGNYEFDEVEDDD